MMDEKLRALGYREFDAAHYLDTPDRIAGYINAVLAENDGELLEAALVDVARARVMHGLSGERPCSTGQGSPNPGPQAFEVVRRTLEALGMKLQVAAA